MFTDNCTLFSTIRDSSDTEAVYVQMQQDLDNIQASADKRQVKIGATQMPVNDSHQ